MHIHVRPDPHVSWFVLPSHQSLHSGEEFIDHPFLSRTLLLLLYCAFCRYSWLILSRHIMGNWSMQAIWEVLASVNHLHWIKYIECLYLPHCSIQLTFSPSSPFPFFFWGDVQNIAYCLSLGYLKSLSTHRFIWSVQTEKCVSLYLQFWENQYWELSCVIQQSSLLLVFGEMEIVSVVCSHQWQIPSFVDHEAMPMCRADLHCTLHFLTFLVSKTTTLSSNCNAWHSHNLFGVSRSKNCVNSVGLFDVIETKGRCQHTNRMLQIAWGCSVWATPRFDCCVGLSNSLGFLGISLFWFQGVYLFVIYLSLT